jgi:hypothetical protein
MSWYPAPERRVFSFRKVPAKYLDVSDAKIPFCGLDAEGECRILTL